MGNKSGKVKENIDITEHSEGLSPDSNSNVTEAAQTGNQKNVRFLDEHIEETSEEATIPTGVTETLPGAHGTVEDTRGHTAGVKPDNDGLVELYGEHKLLEKKRTQFQRDIDSAEEIKNPEEFTIKLKTRTAVLPKTRDEQRSKLKRRILKASRQAKTGEPTES